MLFFDEYISWYVTWFVIYLLKDCQRFQVGDQLPPSPHSGNKYPDVIYAGAVEVCWLPRQRETVEYLGCRLCGC